jgi:hypothetical protein
VYGLVQGLTGLCDVSRTLLQDDVLKLEGLCFLVGII